MNGFEVFPVVDIDKLSYMDIGERAKSTGKQRAYIYSLLTKANIDEHGLVRGLCLRYGVDQFSKKDASDAIDYLKSIVYGG